MWRSRSHDYSEHVAPSSIWRMILRPITLHDFPSGAFEVTRHLSLFEPQFRILCEARTLRYIRERRGHAESEPVSLGRRSIL